MIAMREGTAEGDDPEMLFEYLAEDMKLRRQQRFQLVVKIDASFMIEEILLMRHYQTRYEHTFFRFQNTQPVMWSVHDSLASSYPR